MKSKQKGTKRTTLHGILRMIIFYGGQENHPSEIKL